MLPSSINPVTIGVPVKCIEVTIRKILIIIGKYKIDPKNENFGISNKKATKSCVKPKKFQYHPVWYNASKKKPTGSSTGMEVNRLPSNLVSPEGKKAIASSILVNQVK